MSVPAWWLWVCAACLTTIIPRHSAVRVMVREASVEVVRGDSVTLPCSFFTMSPLSQLNIIWTVTPPSDPDAPTQVIVYDRGQVVASLPFTGRVSFAGMPWSADILLNDTRVSDAGTFRCVVSNPPETGDPGVGELTLSVLAPPSPPECLWDGDTNVGGTVTLSCMVMEGVPTPQLRWDKVEPESVSLPINMEGEGTASVQISNISSQNSGLYRCSVTNLLGSQNCFVQLSVFTPPGRSPGVLQGVLLSLSMALLLLALLVLVLWLHRAERESKWRDGREEDECYNEIRYTPSLIKRSFV